MWWTEPDINILRSLRRDTEICNAYAEAGGFLDSESAETFPVLFSHGHGFVFVLQTAKLHIFSDSSYWWFIILFTPSMKKRIFDLEKMQPSAATTQVLVLICIQAI